MKVEFLAEGSADCPLIRLYSFDTFEATHLKEIAGRLAAGSVTFVSLEKETWIGPVDECRLALRLGPRDLGVSQRRPSWFECALSMDGWNDVSCLIDPFTERATPNSYQWLDDHGDISLLLSVNGQW